MSTLYGATILGSAAVTLTVDGASEDHFSDEGEEEVCAVVTVSMADNAGNNEVRDTFRVADLLFALREIGAIPKETK